jgi:hypothetical protein
MAEPINDYEITDHAAFEMRRRAIAESLLQAVLAAPEQRGEIRPDRGAAIEDSGRR